MTVDIPENTEGVVYDLDGTLVRLTVDWEAVATNVERILGEQEVDAAGMNLWAMLELADETGHRAAVEEAIAAHECEGARRSTRLAFADEIVEDLPTGVCSLNCEEACRIALDTHELTDAIDCVVGRDTTETYKPDPESLLAVIESLGTTPERTLFVGDSKRDEETAMRAGTLFSYVGGGPTTQ